MATKKKTTTTRKRTTTKKATTNSRTKASAAESDGIYFLKLVLYVILGGIWVHIGAIGSEGINVPIGLIIGLLYARQEPFQIDRKIEYAILIMVALISYVLPIGFVLAI